MTSLRVAVYGALLVLLTAAFAVAQSNPNATNQGTGRSDGSGIGAQPGAAPSSPPGIAGQGGDEATLEIAPQHGVKPPNGGVNEIPGGREFRPGENRASTERNFKPGDDTSRNGPHPRPYLGMTVEYTTQCFLGMEEHGLEVVTIDPNSPAEKAGLKPRGNTGIAAAAATAGALLGPLQILTNHFIEKAAEGQRGDLIVAVDDHRVRSQTDLEEELAKLHPGDTMYLTVIRPMGDGQHKTLKIAVKVGAAGQYAASGSPAQTGPTH